MDLQTFMAAKSSPWQRRAALTIAGAINVCLGSTFRGDEMLREAGRMKEKLTEQEYKAELSEALELIDRSGLPNMQQVRIASSLSPSAGGFLVPTPLLAEIFILVEKWGVCRRYFRQIPAFKGESIKLDKLVTEAVAYWTTQGNNIKFSDLVFGQGELTTKKLAGITAFVNELDEDTAVSFLSVFTESVARAIQKKEDLAGFLGAGTGDADNAEFTGMLNAVHADNVVTMDAGKVDFADATADDYKALRDAVNIDFRPGAYYWLPPALVSGLEGLKDLQGRYIYREPAAGMPATLWGYPIADNHGINALTQDSGAGKKFAAFGNSQYMLMTVKNENSLAISREGILQNDNGTIAFNALQADGAIVRAKTRPGFLCLLTKGLSVLKTAAQ